MLGIKDLKEMTDAAYESGQITREKAAEDLVFFWITHWDDNSLQDSQLAYRGEFDILRKGARGILADLSANPIQVDFEPTDEDREDAADVIDGLYRADDQHNSTVEAYNNADQETVICGVGAWELYTEYETRRNGNRNQVIRRKPIYEANNTVLWDPNAKLKDKSDAEYVTVLFAYSEEGYKKLVKKLTGEEIETVNYGSFAEPETSYAFPWAMGSMKRIHVAEIYHRELKEVKLIMLTNPMGETIVVEEEQLEGRMDELIDSGYEIQAEKLVERYVVRKYICDGKEILNGDEWDSDDDDVAAEDERTGEVVPGEHIPIVPVYGERGFVESEEHYEGITRLAKDPQRLRDFILSYLADIASRSPREKPIFNADQVRGFEDMYSESGADNNYPYLLQNRLAPDGTVLPIGPIAALSAPNMPPTLPTLIDATRQAVEDVANPGLPQDIADPDLSGKAVLALQARLDMQSMVYQENRKHAKRRDGEVYASMASDVYDVPREVMIELPDGTRKKERVKETVIDPETGEIITLKDLNNTEFNVFSKISSSYSSQKEQTLDRLEQMMSGMAPGDPMLNILRLKYLRLMDGVDFDDVRDYANKQLMIMGIIEPETDEEKAMIEGMKQEGDKPSAEMLLAQAEMVKGQADMARERREAVKLQLDYQQKDKEQKIKAFEAQTRRMDTQIDAQEAGAKISKTDADTLGQQLENKAKVIQLRQPQNMSDEDIVMELIGG